MSVGTTHQQSAIDIDLIRSYQPVDEWTDLRSAMQLSTVQEIARLGSIVGQTGLEEIRKFGEELHRAGETQTTLNNQSSLLSAHNSSILAHFTPDTIISLHSYHTTVGHSLSAAHSPLNQLSGDRFIALATDLARLSPAECSLLFSTFESDVTEAGNLAPIWSVLPGRNIDTMIEGQHAAYTHRLSLQPNGMQVLTNLQQTGGTEFTRKMTPVMGVKLLDRLRATGQETLKALRTFGQKAGQDELRAPDPNLFRSTPLYELIDRSGAAHALHPELLWELGDAIQGSWMQARKMLSTPAELSKSAVAARLGDTDAPLSQLNIEAQNHTLLNGYCLAIDLIGAMTEQDFQSLLSVSPVGDPLELAQQRGTLVLNSEQAVKEASSDYSPPAAPETPAAVDTSRVHDAQLQDWQHSVALLAQDLASKEQPTLELAFKHSDSQHCLPFVESFTDLTDQVRQIAVTRRRLISLVDTVGKQLLPERAAIVSKLQGNALIEALSAHSPAVWSDVLNEYHTAYEDRIAMLASTTPAPDSLPHRTFTATSNDLDRYFDSIRDMIKSAIVPYDSATFKEKGGIIIDYYDRRFMETFVDSGNHILLHLSQNNGSEANLTGFFMYYLPGRVPESHFNVPHDYLEEPKTSYAELLRIDDSRPSGTFSRLFRGMSIRLQPHEVDYSTGIRAPRNERQARALRHIGHIQQNLGLIEVKKADREQALYVPETMPIDPAIAKLYGRLADYNVDQRKP